MTILGGPNPRMNGELTLKIICFGETPAGNDFEETCVNFNENVVEPFEGFPQPNAKIVRFPSPQWTPPRLQHAWTVSCHRLPPVIPLPKPKQKKSTGKAAGKAKSTAPGVSAHSGSNNGTTTALSTSIALPTSTASPTSTDSPTITPQDPEHGENDSDPEDTNFSLYAAYGTNMNTFAGTRSVQGDEREHDLFADLADDTNFDFDMDLDAPSALGAASLPSLAVPSWPDGMTAPLSSEAAAVLAQAERGGLPNLATMAIDPDLERLPIPTPALDLSTSAVPVPRPRPRPAYGSFASTVDAAVNVSGFNFSQNLPMAPEPSPYRLSGLFECFRTPGRAGAASAAHTSVSASSIPAAAVSPKKGSYLHWREKYLKATGASSAKAASADAAKTIGPTKAATFLLSLLNGDSGLAATAPAIATATTAPVVTADDADINDDGDLPITRPPTKLTAPTKKRSGKKAVAAAKADEKEAAAQVAHNVAAVTNGAKRGPGRPRKQPVAAATLTDTTNLPAEGEEMPVARIFRAPVDHAAIGFRRRSKEAAEKERAAEKAVAEKEVADKRALEIERGWAERVVDGARTLTRVRKAPKHADGTEVQTKKKASAPVGTATSSKSRSWADASTTRTAAVASAKIGTKRKAASELTDGGKKKAKK
ncbi:hypothetical protein B0H16DRAFT_1486581 [Mycena metata]|uniref:Uncharacterized protein n=1 Tax=Mycena metata TaxID=1033252 RepID=A0AAD7DIH6_9AGAR|nr:hypothetical protein B0H16DRAFT_1486581 [Mycena metata]